MMPILIEIICILAAYYHEGRAPENVRWVPMLSGISRNPFEFTVLRVHLGAFSSDRGQYL